MGAVDRLSGVSQHYRYGFGAVQLAVDRDRGSQSRRGLQAAEPNEAEFSSRWILRDFCGAAVGGAFFLMDSQ